MVAKTLITDDVYEYDMDDDETCHYLGQFPVPKKVVSQIENVGYDQQPAIEADAAFDWFWYWMPCEDRNGNSDCSGIFWYSV